MFAHELQWRTAEATGTGMNRRKNILVVLLLLALATATALFHERVEIGVAMAQQRLFKKSVPDRLAEFGAAARQRLARDFQKAGLEYPPRLATFVVLKSERRLEIYGGRENSMRFVRACPVLAASGTTGPKLREGDHQVPEGIYAVE